MMSSDGGDRVSSPRGGPLGPLERFDRARVELKEVSHLLNPRQLLTVRT